MKEPEFMIGQRVICDNRVICVIQRIDYVRYNKRLIWVESPECNRWFEVNECNIKPLPNGQL
jgi:hypothetical protein